MVRRPLDEAFHRAILDSGYSASELATRTGVPQPTSTRFLQGADMKLTIAARIAAYLGISLHTKKS